ncbi:MAG: DUF4440 domain-containing protein [Chthoniobacterales bacterium]
MKHLTATITAIAGLCLLARTEPAQGQEGSSPTSSIRLANQEFMASLAKGDAAALAAMYSKDAQLMPANAEVIRGRDGIQKYWQAAIDAGLKELKIETLEVHGGGGSDTVAEVGKFSALGAGEKIIDEGKFIVIWKREDGKWRLHRDMFSSNQPASASR